MARRASITAIRPVAWDTGQGHAFVFVLVETDAGVVGVGEASQNDQDAAVVANVRQLAPRYLGGDPLDLIESRGRFLMGDRVGRALFAAASGIEQALWDLAGKLLDAPVYQLLGGACHDRLRCYATMAAGLDDQTPAGLAREAARCVAAGFTAVKVVPFLGLDATALDSAAGRRELRAGVERVAAVREAVGPDVDVMIECIWSFDRNGAARVGEALRPYDCAWLEAPLRWDDPAELALLRRTVPQRIASGEAQHGRRAFAPLIEANAVDVLQPDVKWTGGILEAKKVAAWAEAHQIAIAPHNNSGPVATAASAHLAATLPNFMILETRSRPPAAEAGLLRGPGVLEGGWVSLARLRERPGLGVEIDLAALTAREIAP